MRPVADVFSLTVEDLADSADLAIEPCPNIRIGSAVVADAACSTEIIDQSCRDDVQSRLGCSAGDTRPSRLLLSEVGRACSR